MALQATPWQEAFNGVIRLSISEQLQVLIALAKKFGIGNKLSADLNESDYAEQAPDTNGLLAKVENNALEGSETSNNDTTQNGSALSIKYGNGEPYSFFKVASTLNLDGPPDWSENLDAYLYGGKSLDES